MDCPKNAPIAGEEWSMVSDCKIKGLTDPGKCEDCQFAEDGYCKLLDKQIEVTDGTDTE